MPPDRSRVTFLQRLRTRWAQWRLKRQRLHLRQLLGRLTLKERWLREQRQSSHYDRNQE